MSLSPVRSAPLNVEIQYDPASSVLRSAVTEEAELFRAHDVTVLHHLLGLVSIKCSTDAAQGSCTILASELQVHPVLSL